MSLKYYLARYDIEGNFQGLQEFKSQLSLCPMTYKDTLMSTQFGVVTQSSCNFELDTLKTNKGDNLPLDANAFFELYIEDSKGILRNVPVLITNWRSNGETPN